MWTYLQPRSAIVKSTPAPTPTTFSLNTGVGAKFIKGFATLGGNEVQIEGIVNDAFTLVYGVPGYTPAAGDELVQMVVGAKDKVRLLCGDTDTDDQQVTDEEIAVFLSLKPNVLRAAALACVAIAGQLSRKVKYQIYQEIQEDLTAQAKAYHAQAKELRREAARTTTIPFMGGLLQIDKDMAIQDTTRVKPFFTRDQMQEPGTEPNVDDVSGFVQPFF